VLSLQVAIKGAAEGFLARTALARDREGFARPGSRLMFDKVFEVVVVNVVCVC
jgi:hypothetical protein